MDLKELMSLVGSTKKGSIGRILNKFTVITPARLWLK